MKKVNINGVKINKYYTILPLCNCTFKGNSFIKCLGGKVVGTYQIEIEYTH